MWKRRTSDGPTDTHHHLTLDFFFSIFQLMFLFFMAHNSSLLEHSLLSQT